MQLFIMLGVCAICCVAVNSLKICNQKAALSQFSKKVSSVLLGLSLTLPTTLPILNSPVLADESIVASTSIELPKIPLLTKKSTDTVAYSDVGRGFRLLRPFGFNEFEGAGGGYLVKFASLFDVDENVVVGSAPATAGKTSIIQYGDLQQLGEKLATKRGGKLVSAKAKETEGIVFYSYQFENPLDLTLPRPGSKSLKPTAVVELYQLCVSKGRLWSVQATSNDKTFPLHESFLRAALDSFIPRL